MISHLRVFNYMLVCACLLAAYPLFAQLSFTKRTIDTSASGGFFIYAVDLDDDGDQDLLAATLNSGIKWYRNNGGSFTRININTSFADSWSIHAADLDGDGDLDVVACSGGSEDWTGPSEIAWWENDGLENFTKHTVDTESGHPHAVVAADLDDDGDNDIAWAAWKAGAIYWLKNNGAGNFTRQTLDGGFSSGHTLYAADINLDGRVDLAAGGGGRTAWYRNNGGTFTKNLIASGGAYGVYVADVNGDGSPDIVRGRRDNFDVDWLQGPGFTIRLIQAAWSEAWGVAAADLDGDGDTDIYAAAFAKNGGSTENRVSYFLNNGSQSFSETVIESGITRPKGVEIADFDRDGDPDLALITRQGNVIWYENTGSGGGPIATLTLTSPNGGENLTGGANHTITWTSTGDIANVKLEYSTTGGSSYTEIVASTPNDGSHSWTVPDVSSTTALVRVSDAADGSPSDVSNSVFTITSTESLTLIAPNGGESFVAGASHNITWTSVGSFANVKLEYSLNSGSSYTTIIASTPNDGSFAWTVPNVSSTTALVRISDAADGSPADVSNGVFSIIQGESLTLTSPNGGETLISGSAHNITWTATGSIANVKLEYSTNNGSSYTEIIASTPNDGSHSWNVPAVATTQALVRISDAADGNPSDVSDGVFSITEGESLTLVSPNGGEALAAGSVHNITWASTGSIANVKLEYSTDNGGSYTEIIASTPNDGSHAWSVPQTATTQALVRVSDAADGAPSDVSNSVFTILTESITVTSPSGGQVLTGGSAHQITWTFAGSIAAVKIEYSIDNGLEYTVIVASAPNTGSFSWTVPITSTTFGFVRVSDAADGAPSDVNDAPFTIVPPAESLTLSAPNGGEVWPGGSQQNIIWSSTGTITAVKLEYSTNAGSSWTEIASVPNNGLFNWTAPAINTNSALVRISDAADGAPSDVSNSVFTIDTQSLTLTSPNGGESLGSGNLHKITWNSTGNIPAVKLEYSTNAGSTWILIDGNVPNTGSYDWTAPAINTNSALVRISDAADGNPADASNSVFSITISTLTLTSPNGGESWFVGSNQTITWNQTGGVENVKLEFSTNNGGSWTEIIHATPNDGSHPWIVPNSPGNQTLVRISDANDGSPADISDAPFSIINSTLTLTSPNGGEMWTGESVKKITWTWTGSLNAIKLEYSVNNGTTWNTIVSSASNSGSYDWTLPDISTSAALVRIANANGDSPSDVSNGVFTIIGSSLTVLSPNGGESWEGNSEQLIRWSSTGVFPFVKIEYSLNAGASWTSVANTVPNTGSYVWQVANIGSEQALVRISDAADALPMDVSNNVFTIAELVVSVENNPGARPTEFGLSQNYPNPFNPQTKIDFAAPNAAIVRLAIYNLRGELVRLLVDEEVAPGSYTTVWNGLDDAGRAAPSGVYVYRIQIGEWQASKKLLLVK